jgi:uncharacterized phosphosugar-binding protein
VDFYSEVINRLEALERHARQGGLDPAVGLITDALRADGIIQAFGTGHSEAFAMEMAGRAGGLIPSHALRLVDLVLAGRRQVSAMGTAGFERDPGTADQLWGLYEIHPADVFVIASNSGANGSTVGLARRAQAEGHPVIAVTSLTHSAAVVSKHPSGRRLFEVADVVIDNLAPYGDATLEFGPVAIGAVSSITAAYIAQLLTIAVTERLAADGPPPVYLSAKIPGGDEHNAALKQRYGPRINPYPALAGA